MKTARQRKLAILTVGLWTRAFVACRSFAIRTRLHDQRPTFVPCVTQQLPAICNTHKHIPTSSLGMPPGWQPDTQPWRSEPQSCCAYSDTYRFIYIKMAKAAGSTVLAGYLRPRVCASLGKDSTAFVIYKTPGARFSANCTGDYFQPVESDCYPCHAIERWKWIHYYVFTVVRNPFDRAVSSYTYCQKEDANVTFGEWCVNPDRGGGICGNAPNRPDVHWGPQAASLCKGTKCVVDYIAHAESLRRDMDVVVRSINVIKNSTFPPLPSFASTAEALNRQDRTALYSKRFYQEHRHCQHAIQAWYAEDFKLLNYPVEFYE